MKGVCFSFLNCINTLKHFFIDVSKYIYGNMLFCLVSFDWSIFLKIKTLNYLKNLDFFKKKPKLLILNTKLN